MKDERSKIDFDHYTDEWVHDPYAVYDEMREKCPVAHSDAHDGFWLLSRYADVRKALLDWKTFTSTGGIAIPQTKAPDGKPSIPLEIDPPKHTQYRSAVSNYFSRKEVGKLRPALTEITNQLIDKFIDKGNCDIVSDYAEPLLANSLALLFRLPLADTELWEKWANAIFGNRAVDPEGADQAYHELNQYIQDLLDERRKIPRDDLFSLLAHMEVDGEPLSDLELLGYGRALLLSGREATIDGIANSLWYLGGHPSIRQQLINSPDLIRTAAEEFLRYISPIQLLARTATRDVTIRGQLIREGETVAVPYACANRDERVFEDADNCRLDRRPNPHLAFGAGPHGCIGAHLARLDMQVAIGEWIRRIPHYQISQTNPPKRKANGDARGFLHLNVTFVKD